MVRDAGFGRFKTSGLLGDWETLVNGTHEAARWHRDRIDLVAVARVSLAFCLAGRPSDHPIAALLILSRDIVTDDVHLEQTAPTYRRLLDGWRGILESPA